MMHYQTTRIAYLVTSYPTHQDISSRKFSRRNMKLKFKSTTLPVSHKKRDSLRLSANLKLQVQEFEHEISTIPTVVNGVAIKTNPKYNSESHCAFRDVINHYIDNLRVTIENYNKCVNSPNITHKIVLIGDSHIKGFSSEL